MDTVLASLGLGTRYCLVSDDHERPETYTDDEHERGPQTLLERCVDLGAVHEKFSRSNSAPGRSGSGGGGGLLGRLRADRDDRKPAKRERLVARPDSADDRDKEKENAGPRPDGGMGLFERLATRHGDSRLPALGAIRPGHRSDQGSAPLMTDADSWAWNSSPNKAPAGDAHWGSGAAWDDAHLAAPKTKAAKARGGARRAAGGSDQKSLIDLGDGKEDDWQSWEDDAWASLARKN